MKDFLSFMAVIADEVYDLFQYSRSGNQPDPETEKQLAMRIVRKASDERTRREIESSGT